MIDSGVTREEVPPGYQRTEVGVIPDDWGVMMLPEACWFQEGPGLRQWQFKTSGMKVINVTNLENSVLNLDHTDRHIALSEFNRLYQHFAIDTGDMVMASSGNSYGKTAIVREQDLPLMMNTSVIRVKPTGETVYGFLWAFLNSSLFKNQIDLMITGGAQPNFGPYHLKRVLLPFPSLPEQRAIATALSDVDRLIGALDGLIEKKRAIKQAAMQQLLTGKKRLPGFTEEWQILRAGDIGRFRCGSGFPTKFQGATSGDYPFFKVSDMNNEGNEIFMETANNYISEEVRKQLGVTAFPDKSIIFAKVGAAVFLERKKILAKASCLDNNMAAFVIDDGLADYRFLHYALLNIKLGDLVSTTALPSINGSALSAIELQIPPPAEQTAIAAVLSDMDAEIAALERRWEKTKQIKQGMMQQLLTGKVRLVEPEREGGAALC